MNGECFLAYICSFFWRLAAEFKHELFSSFKKLMLIPESLTQKSSHMNYFGLLMQKSISNCHLYSQCEVSVYQCAR